MNPLYDVPVEATVDGIKFHYEDGEVEVTYDVSDSDVVRLTIEPLEVKVTDGFRAAVKKACNCDSSSGGGSGGGVLVVHEVTERLDKTYKEIADAVFCVRDVVDNEVHTITPIDSFSFEEGYGGLVRFGTTDYVCSAENDYPQLAENDYPQLGK